MYRRNRAIEIIKSCISNYKLSAHITLHCTPLVWGVNFNILVLRHLLIYILIRKRYKKTFTMKKVNNLFFYWIKVYKLWQLWKKIVNFCYLPKWTTTRTEGEGPMVPMEDMEDTQIVLPGNNFIVTSYWPTIGQL